MNILGYAVLNKIAVNCQYEYGFYLRSWDVTFAQQLQQKTTGDTHILAQTEHNACAVIPTEQTVWPHAHQTS